MRSLGNFLHSVLIYSRIGSQKISHPFFCLYRFGVEKIRNVKFVNPKNEKNEELVFSVVKESVHELFILNVDSQQVTIWNKSFSKMR